MKILRVCFISKLCWILLHLNTHVSKQLTVTLESYALHALPQLAFLDHRGRVRCSPQRRGEREPGRNRAVWATANFCFTSLEHNFILFYLRGQLVAKSCSPHCLSGCIVYVLYHHWKMIFPDIVRRCSPIDDIVCSRRRSPTRRYHRYRAKIRAVEVACSRESRTGLTVPRHLFLFSVERAITRFAFQQIPTEKKYFPFEICILKRTMSARELPVCPLIESRSPEAERARADTRDNGLKMYRLDLSYLLTSR